MARPSARGSSIASLLKVARENGFDVKVTRVKTILGSPERRLTHGEAAPSSPGRVLQAGEPWQTRG